MGLGALYGASNIEEGMRRRVAARLAEEQARQQMDLALRGANRSDKQLEATIEQNRLSREGLEEDREARRAQATENSARALGDLVPAGEISPNAPARYVGQLRSVGLLDESKARPSVDEGPLLPGDTGRAVGPTKLASALQLDREARDKDRIADNERLKADAEARAADRLTDNERLAKADKERAEDRAEMRRLQSEANDIRRDAANKPKEASVSSVMSMVREGERVRAPIREMERSLKIMRSGMEQAKAGNLNAGSQQILVTFQKILDPTSVVRESEYARSEQGQAFLKRLEGIEQRLSKGGPGITVGELQQFMTSAESMLSSVKDHGASKRQQLESIAKAYNVDPALVWDPGDDGPPTTSSPSAPAGNAPTVGQEKTFPNGRKGKWDGKGWVPQ